MSTPTSHPLDWAVASFADAMAQKPQQVVFDRWKNPDTGEPFTFYVFPVSVDEQDAIARASAAGGLSGHIELLIQRAKTVEGKRIFQAGHRARIRKETCSDDLVDLSTLITRALPPPSMDFESALKR